MTFIGAAAGGTWSPTRPGVYFTTQRDGSLNVWDLFYKHNEPTLQVRLGCRMHHMLASLEAPCLDCPCLSARSGTTMSWSLLFFVVCFHT